MLAKIYNSCYEVANYLGDWQRLNKNDIANLYLDNRHTEMGNVYGAALLCKYWYKVGLIWKNNKKTMSQEDCYEIVWDGIEKAMDYAAWRNPENKLYLDPNGPDKAINVCIDSTRKSYYAFVNMDKRRVHFGSNSSSLDGFEDDHDDYIGDLCTYNDEEYYTRMATFHIYSLIDLLLRKNKLAEAIIVDNICFNDSTVQNKDTGAISYNERKFVSELHLLEPDSYSKYFSERYGAPADVVAECVSKIDSLSYHLLHRLINRTLYLLRNVDGYKYVY